MFSKYEAYYLYVVCFIAVQRFLILSFRFICIVRIITKNIEFIFWLSVLFDLLQVLSLESLLCESVCNVVVLIHFNNHQRKDNWSLTVSYGYNLHCVCAAVSSSPNSQHCGIGSKATTQSHHSSTWNIIWTQNRTNHTRCLPSLSFNSIVTKFYTRRCRQPSFMSLHRLLHSVRSTGTNMAAYNYWNYSIWEGKV